MNGDRGGFIQNAAQTRYSRSCNSRGAQLTATVGRPNRRNWRHDTPSRPVPFCRPSIVRRPTAKISMSPLKELVRRSSRAVRNLPFLRTRNIRRLTCTRDVSPHVRTKIPKWKDLCPRWPSTAFFHTELTFLSNIYGKPKFKTKNTVEESIRD